MFFLIGQALHDSQAERWKKTLTIILMLADKGTSRFFWGNEYRMPNRQDFISVHLEGTTFSGGAGNSPGGSRGC